MTTFKSTSEKYNWDNQKIYASTSKSGVKPNLKGI
jgi:hypothetical protein